MGKIILYIFFGIFDIVGLIVCEYFKKKSDIFEVPWTVFQIGIDVHRTFLKRIKKRN